MIAWHRWLGHTNVVSICQISKREKKFDKIITREENGIVPYSVQQYCAIL